MKKWGILLGLVAIVSIISEVVAESKRLEEPIVLDVVMDFINNQIYVSYLSNTIEPTMIERVDVNGGFYLPGSGGFDMFGSGEAQPSSYMDAPYYSIYDAEINIYEEEQQNLLASAPSLEPVKIHFSGREEAYEADMLVVKPGWDAGFTVEGWENGTEKMTMAITADETLTFTDITLLNRIGKVEAIIKDKKTVSLPVTLQKGETCHIELEEIKGLYPAHQAYIRLVGSAEGKPFDETRGSFINQSPSAEWIKERVEQHHE